MWSAVKQGPNLPLIWTRGTRPGREAGDKYGALMKWSRSVFAAFALGLVKTVSADKRPTEAAARDFPKGSLSHIVKQGKALANMIDNLPDVLDVPIAQELHSTTLQKAGTLVADEEDLIPSDEE